jgi:hypothetical protein
VVRVWVVRVWVLEEMVGAGVVRVWVWLLEGMVGARVVRTYEGTVLVDMLGRRDWA